MIKKYDFFTALFVNRTQTKEYRFRKTERIKKPQIRISGFSMKVFLIITKPSDRGFGSFVTVPVVMSIQILH